MVKRHASTTHRARKVSCTISGRDVTPPGNWPIEYRPQALRPAIPTRTMEGTACDT
jgi:hypothetical protein